MSGVGCVVGAFVLAACAAPGYNQTKLESQLERSGATAAQARCVTKGLTDKYSLAQLGSQSAPTDKELTFTRGLLSKCGVTLPLQPR
jgi:hypothetical protein